MTDLRNLTAAIVSGLLSLTAVPSFAADNLTIGYSKVVKPDAALQEFLQSFRADIAAKNPDYETIETQFSRNSVGFTRGLDPLQAWHKLKPFNQDMLTEAANILVEQGDLPEGSKAPDYRPDALQAIARLIAKGVTFGTMAEVPGSICAPANYKFSSKKVIAFAKAHDNDAYSLRFYNSTSSLFETPDENAKPAGNVRAFTPFAVIYDANVPTGWSHVAAANGIEGYLKDDSREQLGLSQQHVCFGKVDGTYKVTALFGYGL